MNLIHINNLGMNLIHINNLGMNLIHINNLGMNLDNKLPDFNNHLSEKISKAS